MKHDLTNLAQSSHSSNCANHPTLNSLTPVVSRKNSNELTDTKSTDGWTRLVGGRAAEC